MEYEFTRDEKHISYRVEDNIAYIGLNRPEKHNAISDEMGIELYRTFQYLDLDESAHVAVIYGEGPSFSSGADVFQRQMRPREEIERFGVQSQTSRFLDNFNHAVHWKPVVAAVHGHCLGLATAIALRSELVVATESAQFQVTETARGLNGSVLWAILNFRGGGAFADEVSLTGRVFTGAEAAQRNVINRAVPDGEHLAAATELARAVADNPPLATQLVTRVRRWYEAQAESHAKVISEARPILFKSEDFQEAVRAFAEKRPHAPWKGR